MSRVLQTIPKHFQAFPIECRRLHATCLRHTQRISTNRCDAVRMATQWWMDYDANGCPTDPRHPWNRPERSSPEAQRRICFERHLRCLHRSVEAGSRTALAEAARWCDRWKRPYPSWLAARLQSTACTPNRTKGPDRRAQIHFARWDAVRELRDRRGALAVLGYGPRWDDAYASAAERLKRTDAAGSAESIKRSYQKVARAFRAGKGALFRS